MRTCGRAALVALVILAIVMPVGAQTKLKFAHVYETSETFHVEALWAAGEIAKRTNNKYQVDVFTASTLGNEQQISQALPLGTIDMAYLGASFIGAIHKPFSIVNAPYIWRDIAHHTAFSKSPLLAELADGYHKQTKKKIVAITYYGARHTRPGCWQTRSPPFRQPRYLSSPAATIRSSTHCLSVLDAPDPVVRAAVAEAVGARWARTPASEQKPLWDLLERLWGASVRDAMPDARLAVVDAAAAAGAVDEARAVAERALGDADWLVRRRAIQRLSELFHEDRSDRLGPAADLPLDHYVVRSSGGRSGVMRRSSPSSAPASTPVASRWSWTRRAPRWPLRRSTASWPSPTPTIRYWVSAASARPRCCARLSAS